MISIKKFMDPTAENMATLLKVVQVLLEGIAKSALEYDSQSCARFRQSIQHIAESLNTGLSASEILVLAGSASKSMDEYTQNAHTHVRQQKEEFEAIIRMLTETVGTISSASTENVTKLQQIDKLVSSAREVSDVKVIKMRLGDCLQEIRTEVDRQRTESEKATQALRREIQKSRALVLGSPSLDPLTGLPAREAAEQAMTARCASGNPSFVAVMKLDRLQFYGTRFGTLVESEIMRHCADYLRSTLPAEDVLFRWTGATFVTIIDRPCGAEGLRLELKRILEKIPGYEVRKETRSALLPISSQWSVFPTGSSAEALIKNIDLFFDPNKLLQPA